MQWQHTGVDRLISCLNNISLCWLDVRNFHWTVQGIQSEGLTERESDDTHVLRVRWLVLTLRVE